MVCFRFIEKAEFNLYSVDRFQGNIMIIIFCPIAHVLQYTYVKNAYKKKNV